MFTPPLHRLAFALLALSVGARIAAVGEPVQAKHARLELLAEQSVVAPGAELLLGLHFILEPGWHIYWANPGDSGQPPVFNWQLPPGFVAGEIQWPRPERMQSSPQLADYGYHDDVLLMVAVHAPRSLNSAQAGNVDVALNVKWLICREVCLPDRAQLRLALPLGSAAATNPATKATFAGAQKLLPKRLPPGSKTYAKSRKDDFVIVVRTGKPIARADFFPLEPAQVDNAATQKLVPSADGARITLKKSDLLLKPVAILRGVLVVGGGEAYRIETRVSGAQEIK